MRLETIRIWAAILLMLDGSLGLLLSDRWAVRFRKINIRKIAWLEIAAALVLLGLHFGLPRWTGGGP
jgi:hypothetical protein